MPFRTVAPKRDFARLRFPLRGRRVDLVLPTAEHIAPIVRHLAERSVARWTLHVPQPYRTKHGREFLRKTVEDRRAGRALVLMVVRRSDGALLGGVGLHHLEKGRPWAEAGWWLGREHRGQGYATEAVNLLVRTGFRSLGLHRVEARIFPRNRASRALARRCGFRYEGRLRDEARKGDHWQTTLLYARLSSDPPPRR